MSDELKLQGDIRKSVIRDGGYAVKLTNRFTIGIPDLLIAHAPFVPCFAEVKDLGEVGLKFSRKLDVTPLQSNTMKNMSTQYENERGYQAASFLLIGFFYKRDHWLVGLPWRTAVLTSDHVAEAQAVRKRQTGGHYDIRGIMDALSIGTIHQ